MKKIDLAGIWQLYTDKPGDAIAAQVPGDNYSALLSAQVIPDPYYGTNEDKVQWVAERDWTWERKFTLSANELAGNGQFLHCESLDTLAEIRLNGHLVAHTDNMFRRYRFEVKQWLRLGENQLTITCRAVAPEVKQRASKLPFPVPWTQGNFRIDHLNLLRKVQCSSGWDWGICLPVSGIAGEIYLGLPTQGRIEYVYSRQDHQPGSCKLQVFVEYQSLLAGIHQLILAIDGQRHSMTVNLHPGMNVLRGEMEITSPKLWYPAGYGAQPLYQLEVSIGGETRRQRLGLRKLEIHTEADEVGRPLVVRINGKSIFCKGANWIPLDAMPQRYTRQAYRNLLGTARAAHMNMLRVWGGGQYERDDFYELCDELGLLVWQDCMFSCALYPATPEFLSSVREEIRHQVKRLRDHACIALWCGDNEVIGALNWFPESRQNRDRYLVNYDRLNHGVLAATIAECDPTRVFWPSSPCAGPGDFADNWHKDGSGDMHFWEVWHGNKSFDLYYAIKPRFCSEFGFQSFPSADLVRRYIPESDCNVTAPAMEHHQRHPSGNRIIYETMARYFRVPNGWENTLWLSQVTQGLAIRTGVEYWRTLRPRCMGTLYWQLNDNWPVASWSSVEYGGKWKLLHYFAARFYAPQLITAHPDGKGNWEFWVVNDGDAVPGVRASLELRRVDTGEVVMERHWDMELPGEKAHMLTRMAQTELTSEPEKHFLYLRLRAPAGERVNTLFFVPWKRCELPLPRLTHEAFVDEEGLGIHLQAQAPAYFCTAEARGMTGEFTDNGFTLLPGERRTLRFCSDSLVTFEQFSQSLHFRDLRSSH